MDTIREHIEIPFIIGDGIGEDIWAAAQPILDKSVQVAYQGKLSITWKEILAGKKAFQSTGSYLPQSTINSIQQSKVAIKGPLTTPVGGGYTSLNVTLRKELDLYSCIRPVKWFEGLPSPLKSPQQVDAIIFRENTEDLYAGIEFPAQSAGNQALLNLLKDSFPEEYAKLRFQTDVGIDLKPISKNATQRIMRAAFDWGKANEKKKITIVHKGNIMKYTEGAFLNWAYEVAENEFREVCFSNRVWKKTRKAEGREKADLLKDRAVQAGKIIVDDLIADNAFATAITNPGRFEIVVTANLNGDYISDAFAALAGGIGISPGANLNQETGLGLFEANHGSAEDIAGQDKANPSSLILSGAMMFDFLGWEKAGDCVRRAVETTIKEGFLTFDLHAQNPDSTLVSTSQFSDHVLKNLQ